MTDYYGNTVIILIAVFCSAYSKIVSFTFENIDYVSKLDYVDVSKLILVGESQGGLVSCLVAAERQIDKLTVFRRFYCFSRITNIYYLIFITV